MSYTTIAPTLTLFPTATTAPNALFLFPASQSPRDTYAMYEDLGRILRPRNGQNPSPRKRCNSTPSLASRSFLECRAAYTSTCPSSDKAIRSWRRLKETFTLLRPSHSPHAILDTHRSTTKLSMSNEHSVYNAHISAPIVHTHPNFLLIWRLVDRHNSNNLRGARLVLIYAALHGAP